MARRPRGAKSRPKRCSRTSRKRSPKASSNLILCWIGWTVIACALGLRRFRLGARRRLDWMPEPFGDDLQLVVRAMLHHQHVAEHAQTEPDGEGKRHAAG